MRHCMCVIEINQCQFSQVRADTNIHKIISVVASFAASLEGPRNYQLVIGKIRRGMLETGDIRTHMPADMLSYRVRA
jgi:hypothetical protein